MLSTILWALIVGVVLGYLGKLLLPGRQDIPWWSTVGAGIVAALLGTWVASWFGVSHTSGIDWWKLLFQIVFAVIAVAIVASLFRGRGGRRTPTRNY